MVRPQNAPVFTNKTNFSWLFAEFPTTRMEMEAVADIFDNDGDGFIDYKEFVAALRPERAEVCKVQPSYAKLM